MVLFLIFILEVDFQYETTFSHCINKNGGFVLRGLIRMFTSVQGRTASPAAEQGQVGERRGAAGESPSVCAHSAWVTAGSS